MSEVPLPSTEASTLVINGTNSDWYRPIEDSVYAYLRDRWNIDKPPKEYLKQNNRSYDGVGYAHFWVQRGQTNIKRSSIDNQWWDGQTNVNINLLMKRLSKGQTDNMLGDMLHEVRRSLIEYHPHWIAGIMTFDEFNEVPLVFGPDDERNPWQNTWVAMITVNAYYIINTQMNITSDPYQPGSHSAGTLTYNV